MAAPIRTVFRRSILRNLLKVRRPSQNVTAAAFSDQVKKEKQRLKFDLNEIDSPIEETFVLEEEVEEDKSFATLFRNSPLVQMGALKDRTVFGRITSVVNEDLYIDFGGKFLCVCPRPAFQKHLYGKGDRVKLFLHKFEMSSSFLGSEKHVTLLEGDCTLLGSFDQALQENANKKKAELNYVTRLLTEDDHEANTEGTAFRPDK